MLATLDRFFELTERRTNIKTELLAGLTTFLTLVYIVFVNPTILAEAGMNHNAVFVATCLAAAFGCLVMGFTRTIRSLWRPGWG